MPGTTVALCGASGLGMAARNDGEVAATAGRAAVAGGAVLARAGMARLRSSAQVPADTRAARDDRALIRTSPYIDE
jgi:hypothetical protein